MTAERATNDRDADEVLAVMRRYTDAAFRGDADGLRACFHPEAVMSGLLGEQLLAGSPEPFFADIAGHPSMESTGRLRAHRRLGRRPRPRRQRPDRRDGVLRRRCPSPTGSTCSKATTGSGGSSARRSRPGRPDMTSTPSSAPDLSVFERFELERPPVGLKFSRLQPEGVRARGPARSPCARRSPRRTPAAPSATPPPTRSAPAACRSATPRSSRRSAAARSARSWRSSRRRAPTGASTEVLPKLHRAPRASSPSRRSTS